MSEPGGMAPHMRPAERALFEQFAGCAANYLEFGAGGSTVLAARLVPGAVMSVDSSRDWLAAVAAACAEQGLRAPRLTHADIGPVGDWGYPAGDAHLASWPDYHGAVWADPASASADVYFVDGRFRVACAMQVALHAEPDCVLLIHDFRSRPQYHVIREVAREIAFADDLSAFVPRTGRFRARARDILRDHSFECA